MELNILVALRRIYPISETMHELDTLSKYLVKGAFNIFTLRPWVKKAIARGMAAFWSLNVCRNVLKLQLTFNPSKQLLYMIQIDLSKVT